ncbi:MAG TPA: L-histidine N(alpha)-methyltransferase [Bryobacteraceae bacterium]|jgi:dimethylhistidine N-methyltransferase|nr:L-histidine N(alpha)-methyltransferase [Bryobacteraceae bacterium]
MSIAVASNLSQFALDVAEGLSHPEQKRLSPAYLYDDLGSALFEAITLLPEYGLTRADERLLAAVADEVAARAGNVSLVAELGSGSGKKTRHLLQALTRQGRGAPYFPIDVSIAALDACGRELSDVAPVHPIRRSWLEGLAQVSRQRPASEPMLLLFLGSSIGNIDRTELPDFFRAIRKDLQTGDLFLLGADLVKPVNQIVRAYDDPTGVTAAFNRNVLNRINRELNGSFDLSLFAHEARWSEQERRIEMHLVAQCAHSVNVGALDTSFAFRAGETIWTESSHKFTVTELDEFAESTGFRPVQGWVDEEWPFAEVLWVAQA